MNLERSWSPPWPWSDVDGAAGLEGAAKQRSPSRWAEALSRCVTTTEVVVVVVVAVAARCRRDASASAPEVRGRSLVVGVGAIVVVVVVVVGQAFASARVGWPGGRKGALSSDATREEWWWWWWW